MIIKQLSVFLENKTGRLNEVTSLLGEAQINISAFNIADTSEFGILRMIVSDPEKALVVLKEASFSVSLTDVICLSTPNQPGALAKALNILADEGVFIEYLYAYSNEGKAANIMLKPTDIQKCIKVLSDHQLDLVKASDLYKI
ncbi:MAG: amino acid-binding protein [Bacteroidetes bacterium GWF2_42_66]|nr:MAG: amino acid-binding protein [Bacteroidetes bacterium GWA2_42_15]OFY01519.1 MAG: amino acid-binding protein [Bacteroidetes bacterium GWE2_42_39]OFY43300.1 MAG: amino acid-binding protein [Bacteroidetes bacterium GWF2_42_66]HBL77517.1 amino acid-binding protein [Prolixibacteraceae bacterium]HCU61700.1 amino acid-binding protein [Prolixibacteraceae bacterium]